MSSKCHHFCFSVIGLLLWDDWPSASDTTPKNIGLLITGIRRTTATSSTTKPCAYSRLLLYSDVIMSTVASQIIGVSIVCSTVRSVAHQTKNQSSASLVFVKGIHRGFPHKGPVTQKMFPVNDINMLFWLKWNYLTISKLHRSNVDVWEWISNFIPHFTDHVITYPYWD